MYVCVCSSHGIPDTGKEVNQKNFSKLVAFFFRGVCEFQVESDFVVQANAEFANMAKQFNLECLLRFELYQYIHRLS